MEQTLTEISAAALAEVASASTHPEIDAVRVRYLGKTGEISKISEGMRDVSKEDRPRFGKLLNEVRTAVQSAIDAKVADLQAQADAEGFRNIDVTLPGTPTPEGRLHPVTLLENRVIDVLRRMGFALADGPDIEDEWHCFDALNTPADHPARNEQDTFYLPDGRLLRTQTSTVQVRVMRNEPPPIRIIAPGACYRRDEVDATHLAQFNQLEGLYVDTDVSLADMKSTIEQLVHETFGADTELRFRPHFFPFTEPSYEIDIRLEALGGKWMELAGCGMVDPAVFENINTARGDRAFDPEKVSGFAFGFGIDRLAMILAALPDIRLLTENDVRFLAQFQA